MLVRKLESWALPAMTPSFESGRRHYVFDDELWLAVRVALATERPLLLRGAPGCGKTTLAREIARIAGVAYYAETVTSRTEARDLEWTFDALGRLSDAQIGAAMQERVKHLPHYVQPRVLWWAFDPASARWRGDSEGNVEPMIDPGEAGVSAERAVALIDEIDKAEPELANDLLRPFDRGGFRVAETGFEVVQKRDVLLIATTNEARDLPGPFLRRCIVHEVKRPDVDRSVQIAQSHVGTTVAVGELRVLAQRFVDLAETAELAGFRPPGTAEYLDAVQACRQYDIWQASPQWADVTRLALWKHREPPREKK